MIAATLAYGLAVLAICLVDHAQPLSAVPGGTWWHEHVLLPGLRVMAVMLLVALGWPAMFGLDQAPSFGELVERGSRLRDGFNLLMLAGLLLPLLPVIGGIAELVLPVQGMLAIALVHRWAATDLGMPDASAWPGPVTLAFAVLWAAINRGAAAALHHWHRDGQGGWVADALLLWMQLPILLVYARELGARLAPAVG